MLPYKIILCPTDFSEPSYQALTAAIELAEHFKSRLLILHVVPPVPHLSPGIAHPQAFDVASYQKELETSSVDALNDLVKNRLSDQMLVKQVVKQGDPAEEIVAAAEVEGVDLVVIATHGLTGWRRFMFGSVTEKVVRMAKCPVLTIRSQKSS